MASQEGQVPFLLELSSLEMEPLEIFVNAPEQDSSLSTLTTAPDHVDVGALLTGKGVFPVNGEASCCCCCCPVCCC